MDKCKYCHSKENLTIDHKIPKIQGGTDDPKNLQCLCKKCNGLKSGMSDKQIRNIARWILEINETRSQNGKKPFGYKDKKLSTTTL